MPIITFTDIFDKRILLRPSIVGTAEWYGTDNKAGKLSILTVAGGTVVTWTLFEAEGERVLCELEVAIRGGQDAQPAPGGAAPVMPPPPQAKPALRTAAERYAVSHQ